MDREMLLENLRQAEQHVADGDRVLERQRRVIRHLRRNRHGEHMISSAESLLRAFEETQSLHRADVARLRAELDIPR